MVGQIRELFFNSPISPKRISGTEFLNMTADKFELKLVSSPTFLLLPKKIKLSGVHVI